MNDASEVLRTIYDALIDQGFKEMVSVMSIAIISMSSYCSSVAMGQEATCY